MLTTVNQRYGDLVSNVKVWSAYFPAFPHHLRGMGFPIENGVVMVDGTLKETCRPGGVSVCPCTSMCADFTCLSR